MEADVEMAMLHMLAPKIVDKIREKGKKRAGISSSSRTRFFVWACSLLLLGCGMYFTKREEKISPGSRRRKKFSGRQKRAVQSREGLEETWKGLKEPVWPKGQPYRRRDGSFCWSDQDHEIHDDNLMRLFLE